MATYFPKRIEPKWQDFWVRNKTFRAVDNDPKPKYYILDMFPYPSGEGLHVGHPEGYTATDILARYKRMRGFNVLHPMGWDAFGLPAEQYAVTTGTHPSMTTAKNVENFRRQIQMLGFSYDWDREINTTAPDYYKWTQWIFLQLYNTWYDRDSKRGRPISELPIPPAVASQGADAVDAYRAERRLAYVAEAPVNWCPALGTVLANEEVVNGKSERGDHPVVRLPMRQWMLRITEYGERLINDLEPLDWSDSIKEMQRNWIGRSEGAEVDFVVESLAEEIGGVDAWFSQREKSGFPAKPDQACVRVFTTRPDTLYGATYLVLAPEHPMVAEITTAEQKEAVQAYQASAARKSDFDRTELAKEKTGVFTGAVARNPVNGNAVPIWIADYVLASYGTGAIMAVPAHDQRDFEFAQKFDLDIIEVVVDPQRETRFMIKVHEMLGEWERRNQPGPDDNFLKVAILLNCKFDRESFQNDLHEFQRDPLWRDVNWFFDKEEQKAVAIAFVEEDFLQILNEYITFEDDTQVYIMSQNPFDDGPEGADDDEGYKEDEAHDDEGEEPTDESAPENLALAPAGGCDADSTCAGEKDCEQHCHDGTCQHDHGEDEFTEAYVGEGVCVASGRITGLKTKEAKAYISDWLGEKGLGRKTVNYKLRDWLFSRQRYWGEPFPVLLREDGTHQAVDESSLPVLLPELSDFKPTGTPEAPLSKAIAWLTVRSDGKTFRRETNTMPQWAGSCWYYLRFIDPKNETAGWSAAKEKYWMPVDLYVGGAEHAVLHLLYSRFWHKVLYDLGHVSTPEPFQKLVNQGMILGETEYAGYRIGESWVSSPEVSDEGDKPRRKSDGADATVVRLNDDQVQKSDGGWTLAEHPEIRVEARAYKMSKSRGNVINPDKVVDQYGADALRLYEMFMGPLEATKPWCMKGVEGIWRFLNRVWRVVIDERTDGLELAPAVADVDPTREQLRVLHVTIKGVTTDLDGMRFNTAISKLMEYVNFLTPMEPRPKSLLAPLALLLAPFAPHLAEELWEALGNRTTLAYEPWPKFDEQLCEADQIEVALQINNKLRSKLLASPLLSDVELIALAGQDAKILELTAGKTISKSFVVSSRKGKLVNFVVAGE